jgi:hypothetical protein
MFILHGIKRYDEEDVDASHFRFVQLFCFVYIFVLIVLQLFVYLFCLITRIFLRNFGTFCVRFMYGIYFTMHVDMTFKTYFTNNNERHCSV